MYLEPVLVGTDDLLLEALGTLKIAVFLKDRQGRYALINTAGRRILGRSEAEVLGRDDYAFFDPASAATMIARDAQISRGSEPFLYESYARRSGQNKIDLFRSAKIGLNARHGIYSGGLLGLSVLCVPGEEQFKAEVPALLVELLKRRVPALLRTLAGKSIGHGPELIV